MELLSSITSDSGEEGKEEVSKSHGTPSVPGCKESTPKKETFISCY